MSEAHRLREYAEHPTPGGLGRFELLVLSIAATDFYVMGGLEQAVARHLRCSLTTFAQTLNRLIDDPAAMALAPVTCRRHRDLRAKRMAQRGHEAEVQGARVWTSSGTARLDNDSQSQ